MTRWDTVSLLRMAQRRGTRSTTVSACWSRPALYFPLTETARCVETSQKAHSQATWPNHGRNARKRATNLEIVIIEPYTTRNYTLAYKYRSSGVYKTTIFNHMFLQFTHLHWMEVLNLWQIIVQYYGYKCISYIFHTFINGQWKTSNIFIPLTQMTRSCQEILPFLKK